VGHETEGVCELPGSAAAAAAADAVVVVVVPARHAVRMLLRVVHHHHDAVVGVRADDLAREGRPAEPAADARVPPPRRVDVPAGVTEEEGADQDAVEGGGGEVVAGGGGVLGGYLEVAGEGGGGEDGVGGVFGAHAAFLFFRLSDYGTVFPFMAA